ncbi:aminotransferase class V-fold PLP-dependent enzyme [Desulfovibrio sp. OttesenSCG-928-C06]|nr:aminotransferase class V-fold PLP-dependent enzyme [Desulfovibrio sp. OttesenSCG-928-C06]
MSCCNKDIIPMLPGPVSVPERILKAMCRDLDAGHTEDDHQALYNSVNAKLARLLNTRNDMVTMSGEGMLILWGALKSCLASGDKLLSIDTGVFGGGFADMGEAIGCRAEKVSFAPDSTINQGDALQRIEDAIKRFQPKMITVVHCETPSGTINPLAELGEMKKRLGVPLLCVDAVSSLGGMEVKADEWNIDILMGGSQKCLSAPPSMCFAAVSASAWEEVEKVGYSGYDSFLSFRKAHEAVFPYTPYRQGTAALNEALDVIFEEGLEACFARHQKVAAEAREGLVKLGFRLFAQEGAVSSPTVTAAYMPEKYQWNDWYAAIKGKGLYAGESFGPMAGKVFRLGHMGNQANGALVQKALNILAEMV